MKTILPLIGRDEELFRSDIERCANDLRKAIGEARFLVLGGAGSIGQAVTKELFRRQPRKLHVVDLSENSLVELVRDIRSTFGYIEGDFRTFALDIGSIEFEAFLDSDGGYDFVLNLSALKHVRSERDPFTLMRMIDVNIFNTDTSIGQCIERGVSKYFCVSTDKAANPVNMMGASKRIMEMFLMQRSESLQISTARFANVAFSDGSLLSGFRKRIEKRQPIAAPNDVKRYFVTPKESGELCMMSCIFGENRNIFFPKLSEGLHLISFSQIAISYLDSLGFEAVSCSSEDEARALIHTLPDKGRWPCFFSGSDTTGEKPFEEFYTSKECLDLGRFDAIGIIENEPHFDAALLDEFRRRITGFKASGRWSKDEIVALFEEMIPNFEHHEKGKFLDQKM